jgi:hypothetical protein
VRFTSAPEFIAGDVPIKSLIEFESKMYDDAAHCADCTGGAAEEHVRF